MDKTFEAKVRVEREGKDTYLSITRNGYQWSSLCIKDPEYEIPLIIDVLKAHFRQVEMDRLRQIP